MDADDGMPFALAASRMAFVRAISVSAVMPAWPKPLLDAPTAMISVFTPSSAAAVAFGVIVRVHAGAAEQGLDREAIERLARRGHQHRLLEFLCSACACAWTSAHDCDSKRAEQQQP